MSAEPVPHLWSREGFVGDTCVTLRPHPILDYTGVDGPHAPHRIDLASIDARDRTDPGQPPTPFGRTRDDVTFSVSALAAPMPHVWRNAEYDEAHFVQTGELDYVTDWGTLRATPGDFVFLPRAASYRVLPVTTPTLRVIVETPEAFEFSPPAPFGMVDADRDIHRPDPGRASDAPGPATLVVKTADGLTRFSMPADPLALTKIVSGRAPVWRLNLADIQPITYVPNGGPPAHFAQTPTKDLLLYSLSARPGGRPPQHHNADYDELVFFFRGPASYGDLDQPGSVAWIPKAIAHQGPREDPHGGYLAWFVECRGTLRLLPEGLSAAEPMETGLMGRARIGST